MSKRLIYEEDAIDAVAKGLKGVFVEYQDVAEKLLNNVPPAQPEQSSEIQDILEYLDTVLHPIISPDHWNVYSELHDMISMLPSVQPQPCQNHTQKAPESDTFGVKTGETCSDTISRQSAIEIVERYDKSHMALKQRPMLGAASIVMELEELPSVQPEIIRCNDCKHWTQTTGNMRGFGLGDCDYINAKLVNCNGFCYWAERREE